MILRFSSGSLTPVERLEEPLRGVHDAQLDAGGGDEVALDLLGLALAQQAVVDEDAGQPVADGPLHDRGGDRGVDAAGQPADGAARRRPGARTASIDSSTMLSMVHDGRQPAASRKCLSTGWPCSECSTSGWNCTPYRPRSGFSKAATGVLAGRGGHGEALGGGGHAVAVGHPDRLLGGQPGEEHALLVGTSSAVPPYSATPVLGDLAAERLGHDLEAVADAEGRHPGLEQAVRARPGRPRRRPRRGRRTG